MKKSISKLLNKLTVNLDGTMIGGFGQIRGGRAPSQIVNANGLNGAPCTNTDGCDGTTNSERCTNKQMCNGNNTGVCSNPAVCV